MILLAIDPGPEESALVWYDTDEQRLVNWTKDENHTALDLFNEIPADALAVEAIASYGMPVGREVFDTCIWVGRFIERWEFIRRVWCREPVALVFRRDVKLHLCGSARAKDANIRQALIDRYGGKERAIGKKASPGVLHGLSGDGWAALAVAVTAADAMAQEAA